MYYVDMNDLHLALTLYTAVILKKNIADLITIRDVNECQNWYSNIRIGYSNIFEYSNDIHIYAQ